MLQGGHQSSTVRYVDHTYRDFSRFVEEGGKLIKHKKCEANFPANVHKMLSDPNNSDVVMWMPHGRAWKVLDRKRLISDVLPKYIVCKKYESFSRQLNAWGFKRLYQSGPDLGCYYHENFLRGKPKLTCLIRRLPPNLGKSTPFPAGEPNFYRISERYPIEDDPPEPSSTSANVGESAVAKLSSATNQEQLSGAPLAGLAEAADIAPLQNAPLQVPSNQAGPEPMSFSPSRGNAQCSPASQNRFGFQEYSYGPSGPETMSYSSPYQMPQYSQPSGQNAYSYPPSIHPQYYDYPGPQHPGGNYNQYPAQPQQPPQYQYPPPEPPQYQYPPPPQPPYYPPPNRPQYDQYSSPFQYPDTSQNANYNDHRVRSSSFNSYMQPPPPPPPQPPLPPSHQDQSQDRISNGSVAPPRSDSGSPIIEPIPYSPRVSNVARKSSDVL